MLVPHFFKSQILLFLCLLVAAPTAVPAGQGTTGRRILVIDKAVKTLRVLVEGREAGVFPVSFGIDPESDRRRAFDCATPEGVYRVSYKKEKSRFHRALGLSYPQLANAQKGLSDGVISLREFRQIRNAFVKSRPAPCATGLGCGIAIHGGGVFRGSGGSRNRDWTEGCVALDDGDMDRLFGWCRVGDVVIILNSSRTLYGMLRPFTSAVKVDGEGVPVCGDGVCEYGAELSTHLGTMEVKVREGRTYGMSFHVTIRPAGRRDVALLTIDDFNADGEISYRDRVAGVLAAGKTPGGTYEMARQAAIAALSSGQVVAP